MTARLITGPAVEPVTLAEAKLHLRVEHDADNALIGSMIAAARMAAEHETGRLLITQTWEEVLDAFPAEIALHTGPVLAIASVKYIDAAGAEQTLDPSAYALDNVGVPAWLTPAYGTDWPAPRDVVNAVKVRYTAGYGAAGSDVPELIRMWICLQLGAMYENRAAAGSTQTYSLPFADRLLDRYRVYTIA